MLQEEREHKKESLARPLRRKLYEENLITKNHLNSLGPKIFAHGHDHRKRSSGLIPFGLFLVDKLNTEPKRGNATAAQASA